MDFSDFMSNISGDDLDSSYLFIGEEEYLMNKALEALRIKYVQGDFESLNYIRLDERYGNLEALKNSCETLPLMSRKKLVLLKDIARFMSNLDSIDEDEFYKYLDKLGDHLCLILMDNTSSVKKNSKLYKTLKRKEGVVEFTKLRGPHLRQWVNQVLSTRGKTISNANLHYFIEKNSYLSKNINVNLYVLENALFKVADFASKREISREDIDYINIEEIDTNIFKLLSAINEFNPEAALKELNDMYVSNEPIPRIIFMITRQIRLILNYSLYKEKGYSPRQIQEKLQVKDYEFRVIGQQTSKFTILVLEKIMNKLLEIDIKMKTTSIDEKLLLEMFIVEICNTKRKF